MRRFITSGFLACLLILSFSCSARGNAPGDGAPEARPEIDPGLLALAGLSWRYEGPGIPRSGR